MDRRAVLLLAVILTVACAAESGSTTDPSPALRQPVEGEPFIDLAIRIEHPDMDSFEYRIVCKGGSTTVQGIGSIDAATACDRIADEPVRDRLVQALPVDEVCTLVYGGPETATITGSVDDRSVRTTIDRADGCGIADWDDLLAGILPPAADVAR